MSHFAAPKVLRGVWPCHPPHLATHRELRCRVGVGGKATHQSALHLRPTDHACAKHQRPGHECEQLSVRCLPEGQGSLGPSHLVLTPEPSRSRDQVQTPWAGTCTAGPRQCTSYRANTLVCRCGTSLVFTKQRVHCVASSRKHPSNVNVTLKRDLSAYQANGSCVFQENS